MATIPSGQKFQTLSSFVDTKERRSATINAKSQTYTMQDITDTVSAGITSTSLIGAQYDVIVRDTPVSAPGDVEGTVVKIGDTTTLAGVVYTYGGLQSVWTPADRDSINSTRGLLGVALGTNSSDGMLINGFAYLLVEPIGGGEDGFTLYLSSSQGQLTRVAPTTGNVRVAGYYIAAQTVYFNPSQTYTTL